MNTIIEKLNHLAQPIIESLGYEFVGLEYLPMGRNNLLRIYIDSNEGITIDGCALVSRQMSAVLDVEDPITGNYTLEVSSPGIDRPLFSAQDYARFSGECVKLRLSTSLDGRRNFKGIIEGLEENNVLLKDTEGQIFRLPFSLIDKGNLIINNY